MLDRYPQFWSDAFDFQGRIRRIDYWTIVLLNLVIASLLSLMSGSLAWVFGVAVIVPLIGQLWLLWILIGPSDDQVRSLRRS